jgi:hypothetical protein
MKMKRKERKKDENENERKSLYVHEYMDYVTLKDHANGLVS